MEARTNYEETCICGCNEIKIERAGRIISWECANCGKSLANTIISDSPVAMFYAQKALLIRSNAKLREEKGLAPKTTVVTFYDDNGKRILWKDIVAKNTTWEKRIGGCLQRKAF